MKRLFAYMGLSVLVTLAIVFYMPLAGVAAAGLVAVIIFGVALFDKRCEPYRSTLIAVSLTIVLSSVFSCGYTELYYKPLSQKYINQVVFVKAQIMEEPSENKGIYFYEVETLEINGKEEKMKMILRCNEELLCERKDIITCSVELTECSYSYYKSLNVLYMAQPEEFYLDYEVTQTEKDISYLPIYLRGKLLHSVKTLIPGSEGDLCNAIALGDRNGLGEDLEEKFEETGLSHIIVVSGMHLSVLVFMILFFVRWFAQNKRLQCPQVCYYIILCDFFYGYNRLYSIYCPLGYYGTDGGFCGSCAEKI